MGLDRFLDLHLTKAMVCLLLLLLLAGWPAGCFVIRTVADPVGGTMAGILLARCNFLVAVSSSKCCC